MRVGVIADVHANGPALEAVLAALAAHRCDAILSMGDAVGYGPDPAHCALRMQELKIPGVHGNHEAWLTADRTPEAISDSVRQNLRWTRSQLSPTLQRYLGGLPHRMVWHGLGLVHATNSPSQAWPFVRGPRRLAASFAYQQEDICFHGHTHVAAVGMQSKADGEVRFVDIPASGELVIPRTARAFINPGSVGQPRDGDSRSAYAVYDVGKRSIRFFRLNYDIGETMKRMQALGLSDRLIERLHRAR